MDAWGEEVLMCIWDILGVVGLFYLFDCLYHFMYEKLDFVRYVFHENLIQIQRLGGVV